MHGEDTVKGRRVYKTVLLCDPQHLKTLRTSGIAFDLELAITRRAI